MGCHTVGQVGHSSSLSLHVRCLPAVLESLAFQWASRTALQKRNHLNRLKLIGPSHSLSAVTTPSSNPFGAVAARALWHFLVISCERLLVTSTSRVRCTCQQRP